MVVESPDSGLTMVPSLPPYMTLQLACQCQSSHLSNGKTSSWGYYGVQMGPHMRVFIKSTLVWLLLFSLLWERYLALCVGHRGVELVVRTLEMLNEANPPYAAAG